MIAFGKAGELVGEDQPNEWQIIDWISCDCGKVAYAPRNRQGYIGKWALCADTTCRKLWILSISNEDVVGTLDGVMPEGFHSRLIG